MLSDILARDPRHQEGWALLASLLFQGRQSAAGEAALRRALDLAPGTTAWEVRLGAHLAHEGRYAEAEALLRQTAARAPLSADAQAALGQAYINLGELDRAEPCLRRAMELDAEHLDARLGLARKLLLEGALQPGWVEYEWRRRKADFRMAKLKGPEWNGEPLDGKTLLVHSEQGFGDLLQFVRYLPPLARRGARLLLAVPQPLTRLLQSLDGVAEVMAALPRDLAYDYHVPLLTIPRITGLGEDLLAPSIPYLTPPSAGPLLPRIPGERLRVGLVWAGSPKHANDHKRSLPLATLLPLAGLDGIGLYSLQVGPHAADIAREAHGLLVHDLAPVLKDFAETAAVVAQLDLVITVDSAVAHLAGALGRPVWMLTPFAPDWRWILGRDDSPWYPTLRLYRQTTPDAWEDVVARLAADLAARIQAAPDPEAQALSPLPSRFATAEGRPRFTLSLPRRAVIDPGLRHLLRQERGPGYETATRCFIDAHLGPDDVFIDVGAHWGLMSLQAASRWPGRVRVLACEPLAANLPHLARWLAENGCADQVEVCPVAVADQPGRGALRPESSMGHSLVRLPHGAVAVESVDSLLAARPPLADGRVMVKIDVEGLEPEVVEGMAGVLASGRVSAVIWEKGQNYDRPGGRERLRRLRARLAALGFTAWRFADETAAGPLLPFTEDMPPGNVLELAADLAPLPAYTVPPPLPPPEDPWLEGFEQARALSQEASRLLAQGRTAEALRQFERAGRLSLLHPDLYNNLGVALRGLGRLEAAEACYRRALALQPHHAGCLSNLGNVLREQGRLDEAAHTIDLARRLAPQDPTFQYNAGLVARDAGNPSLARALFEAVLERQPDNGDCRWDHALALLAEGDLARGFPAYEARWLLRRSPPPQVPLPRWDGAPLEGRGLFLLDEQGYGDVLMFARFLPEAKRRGAGRLVLQCPPALAPLLATLPEVDAVVPRGAPVPEGCALYAPLLSLPGLLGLGADALPAPLPTLPRPQPIALPGDGGLKLGLVWAGKPTPRDRSFPLEALLPHLDDPRWRLYSLQTGPRARDLADSGAAAFVHDLGPVLTDFAATARLLVGLDALVTCDTAIAHLAGALGLPTFVPLLHYSDWRWGDHGERTPWYPTLRLFRQPRAGDWKSPLSALAQALRAFADAKNLQTQLK